MNLYYKNKLFNVARLLLFLSILSLFSHEVPIASDQISGSEILERLKKEGREINDLDELGDTELTASARDGDFEIVKFLVSSGAGLEVKDRLGDTPLFVASFKGHLDIVKFLVDSGAEVDGLTGKGATALLPAVQNKNIDIVKFLVSKGADINFLGPDGSTTAIHLALLPGHMDIVKYLVRNGADLNSKSRGGFTCIALAVYSGNVKLVKYLIKQGVDINIGNDRKLTPLMSAASNGNYEMVKTLIRAGADIHAKSMSGVGLLYYAEKGSTDIFKYIVKSGLEVDWITFRGVIGGYSYRQPGDPVVEGNKEIVSFIIKKGVPKRPPHFDTALMWAARSGNFDMVDFLIEKGFVLSEMTEQGALPIHSTAEVGDLPMVKYLLSKGQKINAETVDGITPLIRATCFKYAEKEELVSYLIEQGAEVNSTSKGKYEGIKTPLSCVAKGGDFKMVKVLLEKGAYNVEGFQGALISSVQSGDIEMLDYLVNYRNELDGFTVRYSANIGVMFKRFYDESGVSYLNVAVLSDKMEMVKHLLKRGLDINSYDVDVSGHTPLTAAVQSKNLKMVKFLLSKDADINLMSGYNRSTAIDIAATIGDLEIFKYLLNRGAKFNESEVQRSRILMNAAVGGNIDIVEYLLSKDIKVDSPDGNGKTPLIAASGRGNIGVVKLLLSKQSDINHHTTYGFSALSLAMISKRIDVIKLLLEKGADVDKVMRFRGDKKISPVEYSKENFNKDIYKLIKSKSKVNETNR